jgi:hypothetical protein
MNRTTDTYRKVDKFGSGKDGRTEGDPGVTAPTNIRADDLDAFQEEIMSVIEGAGITPDSADLAQLLQGIRAVTQCASYAISGTGVAASTALTLTADTGAGAPASIYTLGSNKVAVSEAGLYRVSLSLTATLASGSPVAINVLINTDSLTYRQYAVTDSTSHQAMFNASILIPLAAGDHVWIDTSAFNGGVGLNAINASSSYLSKLSIEQVKRTPT